MQSRLPHILPRGIHLPCFLQDCLRHFFIHFIGTYCILVNNWCEIQSVMVMQLPDPLPVGEGFHRTTLPIFAFKILRACRVYKLFRVDLLWRCWSTGGSTLERATSWIFVRFLEALIPRSRTLVVPEDFLHSFVARGTSLARCVLYPNIFAYSNGCVFLNSSLLWVTCC